MKKLTLALTLIAVTGCQGMAVSPQEITVSNYGSMDHICELNAADKLPDHLIPEYGDEVIILANTRDFIVFYGTALAKLHGPESETLTAEERQVWEDVISYLPAVLEFRNAEKNQ